MWCSRCKSELKNCTCLDLEERLDSVSNFVYRKCALCGKHYARCRCTEPVWIETEIREKLEKRRKEAGEKEKS